MQLSFGCWLETEAVEVTEGKPEQLEGLLMELVRVAGLLQADHVPVGQPLSMSQAFALHELDTDPPLSQRDLARRLRLEKSTVSRLAAELERKGLLARERDPDNRRFYRLRLTGEGRSLHDTIATDFHERYLQWLSALVSAECDALLVGLPALIRAMKGGNPRGAVLIMTGK